MGLFFGMASLGMPGLGNFIAELLVLIGTFKQAPMFALVATSGLILAAVYSLRMIQKSFFGVSVNADENRENKTGHTSKQIITDLNAKEKITLMLMCLSLIFMGLHPQPIFNLVNGSLIEIASLFQASFQPEILLIEVQL